MCIYCDIGNKETRYECCDRGDAVAEFLQYDYDYILFHPEGRKFAFKAYGLSDRDLAIHMLEHTQAQLCAVMSSPLPLPPPPQQMPPPTPQQTADQQMPPRPPPRHRLHMSPLQTAGYQMEQSQQPILSTQPPPKPLNTIIDFGYWLNPDSFDVDGNFIPASPK